MYFLLPLFLDEIEKNQVENGREPGPGICTWGSVLGAMVCAHPWEVLIKCLEKQWLNKQANKKQSSEKPVSMW